MKKINIDLPKNDQIRQQQQNREMNKVSIEVPAYAQSYGIWSIWEEKSRIMVEVDDWGGVVIKANKDGLISLGRLFLTMAQDEYPIGSHVHSDENNSLEYGSTSLTIAKFDE